MNKDKRYMESIIPICLKELIPDRTVSRFFEQNWQRLIMYSKSCLSTDDMSVCSDVVSDAYVSVRTKENNGWTLDDISKVAEYSFGLVKLYSRNSKYRKNYRNQELELSVLVDSSKDIEEMLLLLDISNNLDFVISESNDSMILWLISNFEEMLSLDRKIDSPMIDHSLKSVYSELPEVFESLLSLAKAYDQDSEKYKLVVDFIINKKGGNKYE